MAEALAALSSLPETLVLADQQDPERLQAAVLLRATGDIRKRHEAIALARDDWRDLLMQTGLEHDDWRERLSRHFGDE